MIALALLIGSFLQGDEHLFIAGSADDSTPTGDSSSFWLWFIIGTILLLFLVATVYFDGKGQKRQWLAERQSRRPWDQD